MSRPVRKPATYQDVLDAPPHVVAELIAGELYTHPRPAPGHATAASVLGMDIGGPFHRGRGGPGLPQAVSKTPAVKRMQIHKRFRMGFSNLHTIIKEASALSMHLRKGSQNAHNLQYG